MAWKARLRLRRLPSRARGLARGRISERQGGQNFVSKDIDVVYCVRDSKELVTIPCSSYGTSRYLTEAGELNSLIIREIEVRNLSLDCDSANAHATRRVQRKLTFIRSVPNLATRQECIGR
jgi:hypothetical protein